MELQSQLHTQSRELAEKQHALQMANAVLKEKVDWEGERSRGKGGGGPAIGMEVFTPPVQICTVVGDTSSELTGRSGHASEISWGVEVSYSGM